MKPVKLALRYLFVLVLLPCLVPVVVLDWVCTNNTLMESALHIYNSVLGDI